MLEMYEKYTNVIKGIVKGDPPPPQNRQSGMTMQHIKWTIYTCIISTMYSYMKLNCFIELGVFNNVCNVHFLTFK